MSGRLTERADKIAARYAKPKEPEDNRSTDEKLAAFAKEYMPNRLKEARKAVRSRKEK